MVRNMFRAQAEPGVVQPMGGKITDQRVGGGYVTVETVVLWISYVFTLVGNGLIEGGKFAGATSATIAYETFTWFTPAGYVFSIWTVIYIALAVWLVSYTKAAPTRVSSFSLASMLFVASCVLNVLWLAVWHLDMVALAFVIILADWIVLAGLYLNIRDTGAPAMQRVPLSIYSAWITVATVSNMAILITRSLGGSTVVLNTLSVVLLTAGVLSLGYALSRKLNDPVFQLVFLWAIVGVGVHVAEASIMLTSIVFAMAVLALILTFAPLMGAQRKKR